MLQPVIKVGSIILLTSAYLAAMERLSLKQLAIKRVAELIALDPNPSYCIKAFSALPVELSIPITHRLMAINKTKIALPIVLLRYKLHQQQQTGNKQSPLRLILSNNQQIQLTSNQSKELIQNSATIKNLIHDIEEQAEEIPLSLLNQEQVTYLMSYIPVITALNTSNSTLPVLQHEIPETAALSSYYLKHTALQQLKEYITTQTIPMLCDLITTASYLDIQNNEQTINFTELATHALADKLLQSPQYQDDYKIISTLPSNIQYMLVQYLIDNSTARYALCSNSSETITNTAQTLISHTDIVDLVSWSPDGKYIASSSNDHTIKIWDTITGICIHSLTGHTSFIGSVVWSPNGKYIASGSQDKTVKVWDASTGTCIRTLRGHTNSINKISWSPDSNQLASSSLDPTIRIWNATTGTCIHTLTSYTTWGSISWSPDGKYIASHGGSMIIEIWDTAIGNCIHTLTGHTSNVCSVSWSPDGNRIATCSYDKTLRLWNIINKALDTYLKNTLSWQQALLLIRISNQHDIDFTQDTQAYNCYVSLPEDIKQLVRPLLSENMCSALDSAMHQSIEYEGIPEGCIII